MLHLHQKDFGSESNRALAETWNHFKIANSRETKPAPQMKWTMMRWTPSFMHFPPQISDMACPFAVGCQYQQEINVVECNGSCVYPQGDKTARKCLLYLYPQQDASLDRLAQSIVDKAMDKNKRWPSGDPTTLHCMCWVEMQEKCFCNKNINQQNSSLSPASTRGGDSIYGIRAPVFLSIWKSLGCSPWWVNPRFPDCCWRTLGSEKEISRWDVRYKPKHSTLEWLLKMWP